MEKTTRFQLTVQEALENRKYWSETILPEMVSVLRRGGLVVLPTETSYMLGGNAACPETMDRLRVLKNRPDQMNMSVMFGSVETAEEWTIWPRQARELASKYLPGPLTLILKVRDDVKQFAATGETLGIRIPGQPLLLELFRQLDFPVTATSANPHGGPEPYSVDRCVKGVDLIWDAGTLSGQAPSTIVSVLDSELKVLRQGEIQLDATS